MQSFHSLISMLVVFAPVQGPSQQDMVDTIKELGVENDYIRAQAEGKIQKLGARLVPALRKMLEEGSANQKRLAAQAASLIPADAVPLVDVLASNVSGDDYLLTGMVLQALGRIGAPARRALPALEALEQPLDSETTRMLMIVRSRLMEDPGKLWPDYVAASRSKDARLRFAGLTLAFEWCASRKDIVQEFLALTRDADGEVRRQAQRLIVGLGTRARDELDVIAHGKNPLESVQAMMMLGHFELTAAQRSFLLEELEKRPRNQAACRALLAAGGTMYPAVLSRLGQLVAEKAEPEVLDRFLSYLQGYGTKARDAAPVIRPLLDRPAKDLRKHTLETLRDIGFEDAATETAILRQLSPEDVKLSELAIGALGSSRKPGPSMLALLVRLVGSSRNSAIRRHATRALGRLGDKAEPVFASLTDLLERDDAKGRQLAAVAFGEMGDKAVAFLEARYSATQEAKTRARLLAAFGELGPKARSSLPLLSDALTSQDSDLQQAALLAVARMGDAARVTIPKILPVLQDEEARPESRYAACTALSLLGIGDPRLVEPLIATSRSPDRELARLSLLALGELSLVAVLPRLLEALEDPDPQVRWRAAFAIGRLGRDAAQAIPALVKSLADPDPVVKYQVERALRHIRGK